MRAEVICSREIVAKHEATAVGEVAIQHGEGSQRLVGCRREAIMIKRDQSTSRAEWIAGATPARARQLLERQCRQPRSNQPKESGETLCR